jgi:hypothetical protein
MSRSPFGTGLLRERGRLDAVKLEPRHFDDLGNSAQEKIGGRPKGTAKAD